MSISPDKIFSSEFVKTVQDYLDQHCVDGKTVTQTVVCAGIGLDVKYKPLLGMLVPLGLLPGYKVALGPMGGFISDDVGTIGTSAVLTNDFICSLNSTLDKCVPRVGCITREKVASIMGNPGSKTENAISQAIKKNLCPGFAIKRAGSAGGIYREIMKDNDSNISISANASNLTISDLVGESNA